MKLRSEQFSGDFVNFIPQTKPICVERSKQVAEAGSQLCSPVFIIGFGFSARRSQIVWT